MRHRVVVIVGLIQMLLFTNLHAEDTATKTDVYIPPSDKDIPEGKLGDTIRYGKELLANFPYYLGPKGKIGHYGGNGLACQSCHLKAGTVPYGLNYFTAHARYPQYRGREGKILTLSQRINNCIERPLNGTKMPLDSKEMVAMVTYMQWLGKNTPVGGHVEGDTLKKIEIPNRPADPQQGKVVYEKHCAVCHQKDGSGVIKDDGIAYQFPPVWGFTSYQPGSSMHRVVKAAQWIKYNMPYGVTWENPLLSDEEAYDVAAYINDDTIHQRPGYESNTTEYPYPEDKPIDYHKEPFADPFPQIQHKFGPYQPIYEYRKEHGQFLGY